MKTKIYNIKEAAKFFNVSEATIRNWVKTGILNLENNLITERELFRLKEDIEKGILTKLNKRANKFNLNKNFIPEEYIPLDKSYDSNIKCLKDIITYIKNENLSVEKSINYLLLNYIISNQMAFFDNEIKIFKNNLKKEIKKLEIDITDRKFVKLLEFKLPEIPDPVGLIYQSIFKEGEKSKKGSYYTPLNIINKIRDLYVKKNFAVCDPCCGTGQFLLSFAEIIENPENLYGFDIDKIAVKIARFNLILKYRDVDFEPNIFYHNFLIDEYKGIPFDLIATNPPWGAHFSYEELKILKEKFPDIKSGESFSYFLLASLNVLKEGGILSFVLPESILNVNIHRDIRNIISKYRIEKIKPYGKIFKKVFSNVIRMDIKKLESKNNEIIFNINITDKDIKIMSKIFELEHTTLKGKSLWALGIVTGNNSRYLIREKRYGFEPVYTGREVTNFFLKSPQYYIEWKPDIFQQVAKEEYYKREEKLIYRFISKNLIFAYDNKKSLTLNSANILILDFDYSIKVVLALFNSSLYQFLFRKKFNSIKVLRSHLESLPLPFFDKLRIKNIEEMVEYILINRCSDFFDLDEYIFSCFNILAEEKEYIRKIVKE
ncbi:MAG TPA: N-6 DNA methylase [Spirochaetota bacterium]|nr:N-6 DNA methylase [Spirochaetota bacterium]HOL56259.1 N-6 DNA methylase [Spirochaetota bacterium]HPP04393.1 N-6 DNA methylase [Spirochaetota bacterium]